MSKKPLYTPVERLDGLRETVNLAEKWMHEYRYRHAASQLKAMAARKQGAPLRILDIACGLGYGSKILQSTLGAEITSIDIAEESLDYAREHYADDHIDYRLGSILDIECESGIFDAVVCYETIEHVDYEQALHAISELFRVLRPGGKLFISTPNRYFTFALQQLGMKNPFHFYEFRPRELKGILEAQNFEVQRMYGQSIAIPFTYYRGRAGKLHSRYFMPRRELPPELCMICILEARKLG